MVQRDPIRRVPFDPGWRASLEGQRAPLEFALASSLVPPVEHIGSTAVPGIAAKPIVDVLAVVHDVDLVDQQVIGIGWIPAPEPSDDDRSTGPLSSSEHISCAWSRSRSSLGGAGWHFRDHLRRRPETERHCEELKQEPASEHRDDPNGRTPNREGNSTFMEQVLDETRSE
ncbi:MAG: GrpB family protein [Acidimicrobiales bacterium]